MSDRWPTLHPEDFGEVVDEPQAVVEARNTELVVENTALRAEVEHLRGLLAALQGVRMVRK